MSNAGGSLGSGTFEKATAAQWREVLDLNLMAAVWCSQAAVGWMHEHGGGATGAGGKICGALAQPAHSVISSKAGHLGGVGREVESGGVGGVLQIDLVVNEVAEVDHHGEKHEHERENHGEQDGDLPPFPLAFWPIFPVNPHTYYYTPR